MTSRAVSTEVRPSFLVQNGFRKNRTAELAVQRNNTLRDIVLLLSGDEYFDSGKSPAELSAAGECNAARRALALFRCLRFLVFAFDLLVAISRRTQATLWVLQLRLFR
jgi:hypothetical protein